MSFWGRLYFKKGLEASIDIRFPQFVRIRNLGNCALKDKELSERGWRTRLHVSKPATKRCRVTKTFLLVSFDRSEGLEKNEDLPRSSVRMRPKKKRLQSSDIIDYRRYEGFSNYKYNCWTYFITGRLLVQVRLCNALCRAHNFTNIYC